MHDRHFPAETPEYRAARDGLLEAERDLRAHMEKVADLRRKLPLGGPVPTDYVFDEQPKEGAARQVKLSELFEGGKETLVLYNFMYGPKMEKACNMCSSFLDGLNGNARHIAQRVNLAVVAKSPIERVQQFARQRGWQQLRMLSSANNTFNRDYFGEDAEGRQNTLLHVFVKRPEGVRHFYATELNFVPAEPGQNQRHIDAMWPLWNVLDLTPEGRGTDWFPPL